MQSTPEKPVDLCKLSAANASKMSHLSRDKFYYALKTGDLQAVKLLVKFGESVDAKLDMKFKNVLQEEQLTFEEYIERAVERGMYSVTDAREVTTPLFLASSLGHHQLVSFLLQQGAEVNLPPKAWRLPIHAACEGGHSECVRLLLEYGADAEATDEGGFRPLHKCTTNDYLGCVHVLVGFNAQVNARTEDEQSNSLLHIAAKAGLGDLVDLLLESGANPNLTNDELDTPLHMACFWTNGEERYHHTVANLVRNGADLNAVDGESKTPLHKACKNADHTIVQLLVDHGAKVNEMDWYGKTPLCHALQSSAVVGQSKGRAEVCVQILLNNGAWPVNPAMFHKVLSGCGYAVASIEVLINSYDRLRANSKWEKSVPDDVWRKHRHFYDGVFSIGKSPASLQHVVRCCVRKLIGKRCQRDIPQLSLPLRLKQYLLLRPGEAGLH
ncbi:ankyrin repeat and SOCS box protein 4-like isoform X1 [Branchiostoma lanceolatum]|uniref:ankyrin repeat and SOCS box protein 4-like isoform X1 n=1 Tax=Branchiostoma lanceolatum TaxID=7740 RepID=UPI0034539EDE